MSSVSRATEPDISHPPQAGGHPELFQLVEHSGPTDPELFHRKEHSAPKAVPKWTAAPSTPPASNSKDPLAVPDASFFTTSLPTETTAPTVAVLDYGVHQQREAEQVTLHKWPQLADFRSWEIRFKSEVSHSSKHPEPLCCGLVKLRMPKVLTISVPQHLLQENQYHTWRILISRLQAESGKS